MILKTIMKPKLSDIWDGDEVLSCQPPPLLSASLGAPGQLEKPAFDSLLEGQKAGSSAHLQ